MNQGLFSFYQDRWIQVEPTAGYTPETNGIAERHNLVLLDMILPMLADSADPDYGLPHLSHKYAAEAALCANDLHNMKPAHGASMGRTPNVDFLKQKYVLKKFRRFGCRVWIHRPIRCSKLSGRAVPGRFLGFERPFGAGIYRVLLDDGRVTQSQTVEFSDRGAYVPQHGPQPANRHHVSPPVENHVDSNDDNYDDDVSDTTGKVTHEMLVVSAAEGDMGSEMPQHSQEF
jgi:hypothetical protein